jgi:DedD protein
MDSRAKQRLTGAVILVALFVLLVPELLTGPKSPSGHGAPEEAGLRRYTIDLNATSPGATPAAQAEVTLPPVAAAPAPTDRAQPGEAAVAPREALGAESEAPAPSGPPEAEPEPTAQTAARQVDPAPATRTSPAQSPVSASAPAPKGSFVVQLGSFGSRDNADRLVRDMNAKGFNTFIAPITTNGRELYRVRVGPTRDRASAEALAARLKRVGQSGSIVPIT